jgi:hypothetical protein
MRVEKISLKSCWVIKSVNGQYHSEE